MATGDTALPLALSSPPQHLLENSPSNLSSPLSEVEDKYDDDHEGADLDMIVENSHTHSTPKRNGARGGPDSDPASEPDSDSKLSEVDINDSEAETERLYDTPPKIGATRDITNSADGTAIRRFTDRRERTFERSPSKLQQQLETDIDPEPVVSGSNTGSEDEEEVDDDVSMASGDRGAEPTAKGPQQHSPTLGKKTQIVDSNDSAVSQGSSDDSTESRKRKRSSAAEHSETEQPPKKRTGSIDPTDREFSADDIPMIDDEKLSTAPESGIHTAEEDNNDEHEDDSETKGETVESVEEDAAVIPRPKRGKRSPVKRRQSKSPEGPTPQEAPDEPPEDAEAPSAVPTPQAEDQGDAEAALRNEEELERKRAAWDELTAIEKQFSNFRERLYQERLEQLNREEEMLQGPSPTHPEYLAMLQCLEERRQEKIRLSQVELELKMSVLNHRAVAERSQVMSQFYQSVRASREKTLEALGQDWHDVQQQRRRRTNVVPEFGLPFPSSRSLAVRQAVSYTREVSILSGFAKHVGFPAAPAIHGATEEQLEDDLEAIANAREPVPRPVPTLNPPPRFPPDHLTTGFGPSLGPAGEQFIEQTPWANPRHPAHQQQRHNIWEQLASAGPSSALRRHSQQPGGLFSSSAPPISNGDSSAQVHTGFSPVNHQALKRTKMSNEQLQREPVVHAS